SSSRRPSTIASTRWRLITSGRPPPYSPTRSNALKMCHSWPRRVYIAPLNPEAGEFRKVPKGWIPRHSDGEEREARKKLRGYFRQVGFRRIGGTRFFGLSLSQVTPTLADLIRPREVDA